ncbi:hypothetical protein [Pseudooceanicola sp. 200-1SW]|uniref:hypothetical protein n=1 Tax=Pseudooceanicola sp. 200-1SW TaxID=3425949 RepID=UPI003D7F61F5
MISRSALFSSGLSVLIGTSATAQHTPDTYWYIRSEWAQCLIENLDALRAAPSDPVVIVLSRCPDVSTNLSDLVTNSGEEMNEKAVFRGRYVTPSPAVVFSKQELNCLAADRIEQDADWSGLPKRPCE